MAICSVITTIIKYILKIQRLKYRHVKRKNKGKKDVYYAWNFEIVWISSLFYFVSKVLTIQKLALHCYIHWKGWKSLEGVWNTNGSRFFFLSIYLFNALYT